ncbi:hypothetical protein [Viridibacillus arvi]|uniref:hypothetical protein n=1 Tax=Viridibacillus arvi TaxID=263475 RepID=UPI003D2D9283
MDRLKFIEEAELLILEHMDKRFIVGRKIDDIQKEIDKVDFNDTRTIILSNQYQDYYINNKKSGMLQLFRKLYDTNELSLHSQGDLTNRLQSLNMEWEIYDDIINQSYNFIDAKVTGLYRDMRPEAKGFIEIYGSKSERGIPYRKHLKEKWDNSIKK